MCGRSFPMTDQACLTKAINSFICSDDGEFPGNFSVVLNNNEIFSIILISRKIQLTAQNIMSATVPIIILSNVHKVIFIIPIQSIWPIRTLIRVVGHSVADFNQTIMRVSVINFIVVDHQINLLFVIWTHSIMLTAWKLEHYEKLSSSSVQLVRDIWVRYHRRLVQLIVFRSVR